MIVHDSGRKGGDFQILCHELIPSHNGEGKCTSSPGGES
jgi:hypothetical protein